MVIIILAVIVQPNIRLSACIVSVEGQPRGSRHLSSHAEGSSPSQCMSSSSSLSVAGDTQQEPVFGCHGSYFQEAARDAR